MSDPASQADELRTQEEKSRTTEAAGEEREPGGALAEESGPTALGEVADPSQEAMGDAAIFGDSDPALSSWIGAPDLPDVSDAGVAEPLAQAEAALPWDPAPAPPEISPPEPAPQRYGAAAWDLSDPNVAAWVSWCEEQGLDPYDPDLLAWANWYYQEQLEGRAVPDDAAPDAQPVPAEAGEVLDTSSPGEWSAGVPEDFSEAFRAEGPGSFDLPAPELLTPAEDEEQLAASPTGLEDGAGDPLASLSVETADVESDFDVSTDDLGPILEVGVDVFEIFDDEMAAPREWIPQESLRLRPTSPGPRSEPTFYDPGPLEPESEPISSQPAPSASPPPEPIPLEPIPLEPEPPVMDAAALGMVPLDSPQQETALFDLEQAATTLAELEASLLQDDGSVGSSANDAPASEEAAPERTASPDSPLEAQAAPSANESTSSFLAEPAPSAGDRDAFAAGEEPGETSGLVAGTHRVVIHTMEGDVKRGTVTDVELEGDEVSLDLPGGERQSLPRDRIRAVFFMLGEGEAAPAPEGIEVRVTFRDGRQLAGVSPDYDPDRGGFFVIPAEGRSRTARIWVYRAAARQISVA